VNYRIGKLHAENNYQRQLAEFKTIIQIALQVMCKAEISGHPSDFTLLVSILQPAQIKFADLPDFQEILYECLSPVMVESVLTVTLADMRSSVAITDDLVYRISSNLRGFITRENHGFQYIVERAQA
jgi:hypothetical protein